MEKTVIEPSYTIRQLSRMTGYSVSQLHKMVRRGDIAASTPRGAKRGMRVGRKEALRVFGVEGEPPEEPMRPARIPLTLSQWQVDEIFALRRGGYSVRYIANEVERSAERTVRYVLDHPELESKEAE